MRSADLFLWLIPLAPLVAAILAGLLALTRRAEKAAPLLTILGTAAAGAFAFLQNPGPMGAPARHVGATWLSIPPAFNITLGVHVDQLTWLMLMVVCVVSLLVQVYSTGYMKSEAGYARYFAYLGLFTACMIGLVVADNLFQLYVCWELVGICSYLLIGFWWQKPSAASAAKKAFVVTRFGDVGFLLGVLLLVSAAGSFAFGDITKTVANIANGVQTTVPFVRADTFLWLAPLLLFCGAIGKSAQFPLHIWLPDAMEGPTPVSALIHAATMVAAGVYMVARLFPIFRESGVAMDTVLLIGAVTALLGATVALVQTDIKKLLAYSTISQLGLMMLGLGVGGSIAAVFHLTTHAMFKALLFLGAGSVIHALHHSEEPNDLRRMGGLGRRMKHTAATCGIGVLALAGLPPFSGFWSKDAILHVAFHSENPMAKFGLAVGVMVAGLTAFYSVRMWLLAFWGTSRSEAAAEAHESPTAMLLPLWILSLAAAFLGFILHQDERISRYLGSSATEVTNWSLMLTASAVAFLGAGLAWSLYAKPQLATDPMDRLPGRAFLAGGWVVEGFWSVVGAKGSLAMGRTVAAFDRNVIDGAVNGIGSLHLRAGGFLRRSATGQTQKYALAMLTAIVLLAALLIWFESKGAPPEHIVMKANATRSVMLTDPAQPGRQ